MSAALGIICRQAGSPEDTIMVDVEPGDTTGIYYVPVCGVCSQSPRLFLVPKDYLLSPFSPSDKHFRLS